MRYALAILLLLLAGCSLLSPDDDSALFRTDASHYEVRQTSRDMVEVAPIVFSYTNTRMGPVYLPGCGGPAPSLQKQVDGKWVEAWSPIVPLCLQPSVRVRVGGTYTDTLFVGAGLPSSNRLPQFQVIPIEGTYRVVLPVDRTEDPEQRELLPLGERVSNPFELHEVTD